MYLKLLPSFCNIFSKIQAVSGIQTEILLYSDYQLLNISFTVIRDFYEILRVTIWGHYPLNRKTMQISLT